MNNDLNNQQGLSYQGGVNNVMPEQAPVEQPMMAQPEMPQQPMMDQTTQEPVQPNPSKFSIKGFKFDPKDKNSLILLLPLALVVIIVLVLFVNLVATRTLKCKEETENNGIETKSVEKVKFKFGKIHSKYSKAVIDFSDSEMDKDDLKDQIKTLKSTIKDSCKSKDGCKYSFKEGSKKVTVVIKQKYDKDAREDFEDVYDSFKDYKEVFDEACDD